MEVQLSSLGVAIVHNEVVASAVGKLLSQKCVKLRSSERVVQGSVIFSKAKLAFLLVKIPKAGMFHPANTKEGRSKKSDDSSHGCDPTNQDDIMQRVGKFISIHQQCYIILQAPLFTLKEFEFLSKLQSQYLSNTVDFLPAHSAEDCVEAMLTLVSLQSPPKCEALHQRFCDLMNTMLQPRHLSTLPSKH